MKNFKKYIVEIVVLIIFILPTISLAQVQSGQGSFGGSYQPFGGGNLNNTSSGSGSNINLGSNNVVNSAPVSNGTNAVASTVGCKLIINPKLGDLFKYVTCIISDSVIPLIFALALAMFVWGVVQYVINTDEEAKKAKGKQFMIWGIIALTVMVCVWGLVHVIGNTFGIENVIPKVQS